MTDILYEWPSGARFGSRVPKERFYERTANNSVLRGKFVSEVRRIRWMYKLAEETINLPAAPEVPEIEVLWLDAKAHDIDNSVLAAIDRAIPNPVIFEIHRESVEGQAVRMTATHKTTLLGSLGPNAYFSTGWMRADVSRTPIPIAISLPALHWALIAPLTPITARPGEPMSEVATRLDAARKLEREISALERKLRSEPQLNRKLNVRRELVAKLAELEHER